MKIGVLILSDRASSGVYEDKSGQEIMRLAELYFLEKPEFDYRVIEDDKDLIKQNLQDLSAKENLLILTSGGTGISKRDVTPEATQEVCEKMLPGFGEIMRAVSYGKVPTAILSRSSAGVLNKSLIVNMPGSPKAIKECLDAVFAAIIDGVEIISGYKPAVNEENVKIYKPHHHAHDKRRHD